MSDWSVPKGRRACAGCGRPFQPGDAVLSLLHWREKAVVREDRCDACAAAADRGAALSHWRTVAPAADQPKRAKLDAEAAADLWRRLVAEQRPEQRALTYVLTLVLVRRKTLALKGQEEGPALPPIPEPVPVPAPVPVPVPVPVPDGAPASAAATALASAAAPAPAAPAVEAVAVSATSSGTGGAETGPQFYLLVEIRDTGEALKVPDVPMSEAQIGRVTEELKDLFQGDV